MPDRFPKYSNYRSTAGFAGAVVGADGSGGVCVAAGATDGGAGVFDSGGIVTLMPGGSFAESGVVDLGKAPGWPKAGRDWAFGTDCGTERG